MKLRTVQKTLLDRPQRAQCINYKRGLNNYLYYLGDSFLIRNYSNNGPQNPILISKAPIVRSRLVASELLVMIESIFLNTGALLI